MNLFESQLRATHECLVSRVKQVYDAKVREGGFSPKIKAVKFLREIAARDLMAIYSICLNTQQRPTSVIGDVGLVAAVRWVEKFICDES